MFPFDAPHLTCSGLWGCRVCVCVCGCLGVNYPLSTLFLGWRAAPPHFGAPSHLSHKNAKVLDRGLPRRCLDRGGYCILYPLTLFASTGSALPKLPSCSSCPAVAAVYVENYTCDKQRFCINKLVKSRKLPMSPLLPENKTKPVFLFTTIFNNIELLISALFLISYFPTALSECVTVPTPASGVPILVTGATNLENKKNSPLIN